MVVFKPVHPESMKSGSLHLPMHFRVRSSPAMKCLTMRSCLDACSPSARFTPCNPCCFCSSCISSCLCPQILRGLCQPTAVVPVRKSAAMVRKPEAATTPLVQVISFAFFVSRCLFPRCGASLFALPYIVDSYPCLMILPLPS